jgi:hypothetical protein
MANPYPSPAERQRFLDRDRVCTLCKRLLPPTNFFLDTWKGKTKRKSRCIDCQRVAARLTRKPEVGRKRHGKRNPLKQHARNLLQSAVRRGKIIPKPCVVCGEKVVHGHHSDYSKPFEIVWLCRPHHMQEHRKPVNTPITEKILAERIRGLAGSAGIKS